MVVLTDRFPQEVLSMNELEFSEFFGELIAYMEKQKWSHLAAPLTEDLNNEISDLTNKLDRADDDESELRGEIQDRDVRIMNFKNELEGLLNKL